MQQIILASNSPRRKELLSMLSVPFTVQESHVDERALEEADRKAGIRRTPAEQASFMAEAKGTDVSRTAPANSAQTIGTKVVFRSLTEEEMDAYIATGEPMDKAGAYGIQGKGSLLVERMEGDYFNVVGLPLTALYEELRAQGISLMENWK